MFRFIALLWNPQQSAQQVAIPHLLKRIRAFKLWNEFVGGAGLHIFFSGETCGYACRPLEPACGTILGLLFSRASSRDGSYHLAEKHLDLSETEKIVGSGGLALLRDYWGDYVAFLRDTRSGARYVVKDPSGTLPCHWRELGGVSVFFSSLADFVALRIHRLDASDRYVRTRVGSASRGRHVQPLEKVQTLLGGEQLTFRGCERNRRFLWNPLALTPSADFNDFTVAAGHLRMEVARATHAWASLHGSIVHRISGGLDSSIVLGCLKTAPSQPAVTGINYFIPGGVSDERPWARLAAGDDFRVVEQARSQDLDLASGGHLSPAVHPVSLFDYVETRKPELAISRSMKATAVFNGEGGDSLFYHGAAPHAAGDLLRARGLTKKLVCVAADVAVLADTTVWHVLAGALRAALTQRDVADERLLRIKRVLASPDICMGMECEKGNEHPWFREAARSSLSIRLRLGSLLARQPHYDPLGEDDVPYAVSPLLSQPVIEACLRIPIHVHIQGGIDRALARHAFENDVHPAILARTWKDRAQGFLEHVLVANRLYIREVLLDGQLMRDGLLDKSKVERALSESPRKRTGFLAEIFDHFDTELWLASLARANAALH